ncbi:hypothetical protein A2U01_0079071, partial [Trifolium medium]|nr:hypothetical protein [Trifolium medium]
TETRKTQSTPEPDHRAPNERRKRKPRLNQTTMARRREHEHEKMEYYGEFYPKRKKVQRLMMLPPVLYPKRKNIAIVRDDDLYEVAKTCI